MVEPAQAVDESIPVEVVVAEKINNIVKSFVEAAQSLAKTAQRLDAATDENAESTPADATPAAAKVTAADTTPAPARATPADVTPPTAPAAKAAIDDADPEAAPVSDVKQKEAEIDSIAAQIEEEKIRSAQRIAELEGQLVEARDELTAITSTDGEGFIRAWLVLGPIRVDEKVSNHDEESNKDFLDRQYVPSGTIHAEGWRQGDHRRCRDGLEDDQVLRLLRRPDESGRRRRD